MIGKKSYQNWVLFAVIGLLLFSFCQMVQANSDNYIEIIKLGSIGNKKPGDIATLKAQVWNTGNRTLGPTSEVIFWVQGGEINQIIGSISCQGLPGEDSGWYGYDWTIPANAAFGRYKYWAIVKENGNYVSDWSDAKSFNVISPEAEKEVEIVNLWKVEDTQQGETATLWAKVKNTGTLDTGSSCRVKFWVSWISASTESTSRARSMASASDIVTSNFVGEANCDGLKTGQSRWHKYKWAVPENAKTGSHEYKAIVEEEGRYISEWSSGKRFNIIASVPEKHAEVIELRSVEDTTSGQVAVLRAKVKNTGNSNLGSTCKVKYWVNGGNINEIIGNTNCAGLATGETNWYSFDWQVPDNALTGAYKYWAIVEESGDYIGPWSNSKSFQVTQASSGKSAEVIELRNVEAEPGDSVLLGAKVKNIGALTLGPNSQVSFWVSGKGVNGIIGEESCSGLTPRDSRWYDFNWRVPEDAESGEYYKYWVMIREEGSYLSAWSSPEYIRIVSPEKSAEVIGSSIDYEVRPGDDITLWANVENTGEVALGDNCEVRYWVRGPGGGINGYIGDTSCRSLSVGGSEWYSYTWEIPTGAESGTYKYWAIVVDDGEKISSWSKPEEFEVV